MTRDEAVSAMRHIRSTYFPGVQAHYTGYPHVNRVILADKSRAHEPHHRDSLPATNDIARGLPETTGSFTAEEREAAMNIFLPPTVPANGS